MKVIGIESGMRGMDNQIRGLILASSQNDKVPCTRDELLKDANGTFLHRDNYPNEADFRSAVFSTLSTYCQKCEANKEALPEYVALPYNHAGTQQEGEHVEALSKAVKDFFIQKKHPVKTIVLTSKVHSYKSVDLVNVGQHQMSKLEEMHLRVNPELKNKTIITEGVASNLSWLDIKMRSNTPEKAREFAQYQGKKVALISLGGKTGNGAIQFNINDAKKLLENAEKLQNKGYEIIFTNSPRTPNDVTDYLYENCQNKNMAFYNSKSITDNPQEAIDNFTVYNGKYNEEFKKQSERTNGNIYPAVLSLVEKDGFVVNTWDSFSYTSDASALGITSAVYDGNTIDTEQRPDCKKLFDHCLEQKYIKRFDDAFISLPDKMKKTQPMAPVNTVLVASMEKVLQQSARNRGTNTQQTERE